MADESGVPTEKEIVDLFNAGGLIAEIFDRYDFSDGMAFDTCISLHNVGRINLLSLPETDDFKNLEGHQFFTGQHFFCKAIPLITAPVAEMMRCVRSLVEKGGADLAANQPNAAFREWCIADLARAHEVVAASRNNDLLANEFVTFALIAGNMMEEAIDFVRGYTDGRQLSGIAALGRMNYPDPAVAPGVLKTLFQALDKEPDHNLCGNILLSALAIAEKTSQITGAELVGIVRRVCSEPGSQTSGYCARAFWLHAKSLSEETVRLLLQAVASLDPLHKGVIRELDNGLRDLLDTPFAALGIEFAGNLISSSEGALALSEFQGFGRRLLEGAEERFHRTFVSWMLTGKRPLCEGMNALLRRTDRSERAINISLEEFSLSSVEQIFLCRKAIGYFFFQPVIAASVLVSVLRICDEKIASTIRGLLLDPLLLNYGGVLREYLDSIEVHDRARPHVEIALKENEQYLAALKSVGNIREIHPSEHERQAERLRVHDQVRAAHKEAEKESVFLSLVRRSVILYGKRTITYFEGPGEERRSMEMELKQHSVAVEVPRAESIDPIGLDYTLRVFRAERRKS